MKEHECPTGILLSLIVIFASILIMPIIMTEKEPGTVSMVCLMLLLIALIISYFNLSKGKRKDTDNCED